MSLNTKRMSTIARATFNTPAGQQMLADLREQFYDRSLNVGEPHGSAVRIGEHNVVLYINELLEEKEHE